MDKLLHRLRGALPPMLERTHRTLNTHQLSHGNGQLMDNSLHRFRGALLPVLKRTHGALNTHQLATEKDS